MVDYNGNIVSFSLLKDANAETDGNNSISFSQGIIEGDAKIQYYLMRATDPDCGSLTYRTWVVINSPDINASQYSGIKCGASALTDIIVAAKWTAEI